MEAEEGGNRIMDLKGIFINMGILGLFVFGMMAFIITTQTDNDVAVPITNNSLINSTYGDLEINLSSTLVSSQTAMDIFGNATPTQQYGELEVNSIVSPTKIIKTMIVGLWNILIKLPQVILGVSPIVAGVISAILGILIIIGIWAIYKGVVS